MGVQRRDDVGATDIELQQTLVETAAPAGEGGETVVPEGVCGEVVSLEASPEGEYDWGDDGDGWGDVAEGDEDGGWNMNDDAFVDSNDAYVNTMQLRDSSSSSAETPQPSAFEVFDETTWPTRNLPLAGGAVAPITFQPQPATTEGEWPNEFLSMTNIENGMQHYTTGADGNAHKDFQYVGVWGARTLQFPEGNADDVRDIIEGTVNTARYLFIPFGDFRHPQGPMAHWALLVVDLLQERSYCFDSMSTSEAPNPTAPAIRENLDRYLQFANPTYQEVHGPRQEGRNECGLFVLEYFRFITENLAAGRTMEQVCALLQDEEWGNQEWLNERFRFWNANVPDFAQ